MQTPTLAEFFQQAGIERYPAFAPFVQLSEHSTDKVTEARMAELYGTTRRALQSKRFRKVIPEDVWTMIDGKIYYSIRRYEEWLEKQWAYPRASNSSVSPSASDSPGTASGAAKPSASRNRKKESQRPQVFVLR
ncbi:MAG: hypothetical protein Q8R69_00145 [Telluria sp.]|nr:hypothetical protein [Telluria sp.]